MADRFLIHRPSGVVFIRDTPWVSDPAFEEVGDALGTPLTSKQRKALAKLELDEAVAEDPTEPAVDEVPPADAALSADASIGLP
jgi:hypothetical protein